jgi:hypothetical protein
VDPAKLADEPTSNATAARIRVFFIEDLLFGVDPNVRGTKKFSFADKFSAAPAHKPAMEPRNFSR